MAIGNLSRLRATALGSVLLGGALLASGAIAAPWFGQKLPPPVNDPAVDITTPTNLDIPGQPAIFAPGPKDPLFAGDRVKADTAAIIGFSLQSKADGNYLWGRITGTKAYYDTVAWTVKQLQDAGVKSARLEDFTTELTIPSAGELRILGDASYGDGSSDIVLQSAMVGGRGPVNGTLTAPLIYVGHGSQADLIGRDIKGKIAVIHTTPNPGIYSADENGRVADLVKLGAAGTIEILDQMGNMMSFDNDRHGCGTGLCLTVGGADGFFLENMLGKAGTAGKTVSAKLSATATQQTGLKAANALAVIPGKDPGVIMINAHADSWFVGGDDNAGGLAVGIALTKYFQKHPLKHTYVFLASAGHHTQGRGIPEFRKLHDGDIVKNMIFAINLEHVAGAGKTRSAVERNDANFGMKMDWATTETPMAVAVTNRAPYLIDLWRQGVECFGLSTSRVVDLNASGEPGAYKDITDKKTVPLTQIISGDMLYHTSGENAAAIPAAGLERAARFYAYMIQQVDKATPEQLSGSGPANPHKSCPATP